MELTTTWNWNETSSEYISVDLGTKKTIPERIIFNGNATILFWSDGTKTVSICKDGDVYNEETGVLNCIAQKYTKQLNKKVDNLLKNATRN